MPSGASGLIVLILALLLLGIFAPGQPAQGFIELDLGVLVLPPFGGQLRLQCGDLILGSVEDAGQVLVLPAQPVVGDGGSVHSASRRARGGEVDHHVVVVGGALGHLSCSLHS